MSSPRRRLAARRKRSQESSPMAGPPAMGELSFILAATLRRPHGLKGEVAVSLETDFPDRLQKGTRLYLGEDHVPVAIASRRPHADGLLLSFEEFPDLASVQPFRNVPLFVPVEDRPPLPEGEYYQHQLLGLQVVEEDGAILGTLAEILATGANDVYLVRPPDGGELLLPATSEVVRQVSLAEKRIVVHLLPGLREITNKK
ncbi:MAG: ribosome maturation factor RimM [Anaerolineales bacterium]